MTLADKEKLLNQIRAMQTRFRIRQETLWNIQAAAKAWAAETMLPIGHVAVHGRQLHLKTLDDVLESFDNLARSIREA